MTDRRKHIFDETERRLDDKEDIFQGVRSTPEYRRATAAGLNIPLLKGQALKHVAGSVNKSSLNMLEQLKKAAEQFNRNQEKRHGTATHLQGPPDESDFIATRGSGTSDQTGTINNRGLQAETCAEQFESPSRPLVNHGEPGYIINSSSPPSLEEQPSYSRGDSSLTAGDDGEDSELDAGFSELCDIISSAQQDVVEGGDGPDEGRDLSVNDTAGIKPYCVTAKDPPPEVPPISSGGDQLSSPSDLQKQAALALSNFEIANSNSFADLFTTRAATPLTPGEVQNDQALQLEATRFIVWRLLQRVNTMLDLSEPRNMITQADLLSLKHAIQSGMIYDSHLNIVADLNKIMTLDWPTTNERITDMMAKIVKIQMHSVTMERLVHGLELGSPVAKELRISINQQRKAPREVIDVGD